MPNQPKGPLVFDSYVTEKDTYKHGRLKHAEVFARWPMVTISRSAVTGRRKGFKAASPNIGMRGCITIKLVLQLFCIGRARIEAFRVVW